jgi:uncharacterized protein (DUF2141 family)
MTRRAVISAAVLLLGIASVAIAQSTGDLTVTATYKGKGPIDETHEILVFVFDTPDITPGMRPLGVQRITKNGGSATFKNLDGIVYVRTAYDESGTYDAQLGPPVGLPIGMYTTDRKTAAPVKIAPGTKVSVVFTEAIRYQ